MLSGFHHFAGLGGGGRGSGYDPGLGNQTDLRLGCTAYGLCGLQVTSLGFSSFQLCGVMTVTASSGFYDDKMN